jgi:hypothetical protein
MAKRMGHPVFQWTVLEKMKLDRQKGPTKFEPFYSFFPDFFLKWYLKQSKFLHHCTQWIKTLHISLMKMNSFEKNQEKMKVKIRFSENNLETR